MSHTLINCTWKESTVSLYFRLLWYHSILRDSIDQKHAKKTKFEDKTVKSTLLSLVPVGPPWFPDLSRRYGACVRRGREKHMFGVSLYRPSRQSSPRRAKKDSNIPSPGRTRSVKCPTPGPTKTIKSPPHTLPPSPLPTGFTLIGA